MVSILLSIIVCILCPYLIPVVVALWILAALVSP